ncbi:hypothetical protein [Hydrogenophaga sp.]|uniref:hypothetical protein n=1 Tax=Hydrogenophaga sp. TaxID=1904254 RepID=UPI003F6E8D56
MPKADSMLANSMRAGAVLLAVLTGQAHASLDGYPSVTQYLSNDAPFVVFGVTPTRLNEASSRLTLTFIATDPLDQVNVFPFVRHTPDGPARLRPHVTCGPREPGSWNCHIPVADLLREFKDGDGEIGLRIEAHGNLRSRGQHSTVIVTVPVRHAAASASR